MKFKIWKKNDFEGFQSQKWRKKVKTIFRKLKKQPNNTWYNWGVDVQ